MAEKSLGSKKNETHTSRRGKGPIYAEINPKKRVDFYEACKALDLSEREVIEALVDYFMSKDVIDRSGFVRGPFTMRGNLSRAIELIQWGQHSYSNKRWEWSSKVHLALLEECESIHEVRRFAFYRLGFVQLCIVNNLIDEMLNMIREHNWRGLTDNYKSVVRALSAGLHFNIQALARGELAVARYNISCCSALMALAILLNALPWEKNESTLNQIKTEISSWLNETSENPALKDNERAESKWWLTLGQKWRQIEMPDEEKKNLKKRIEALLAASIKSLVTMVTNINKSIIPCDAGELIRWSKSDFDLIMLRTDKDYSPKYDAWAKPITDYAIFNDWWEFLKSKPEGKNIIDQEDEKFDENFQELLDKSNNEPESSD